MQGLAIFFLALLPLAACADDVDTAFDPCSPLVVVPGAATQPGEEQAIQSAIDAWSAVLPTQLTIAADPGKTPAVRVFFDEDAFYRAIYFDTRAEIRVNRTKLASEDIALALAHELGHAFGLLHTAANERRSVMNVGNLEVAPTLEDARAVADLWDACLPP